MKKIEYIFLLSVTIWSGILITLIFSLGHDVDESTHSLVGIFIKDFLIDWSNNPKFSIEKMYNYSISYLTYYPKISLHYPPLPQIIFGLTYFVLPISIYTTRLVTFFFSLILIFIIYQTTFMFFKKREISLICALLLMTSPTIVSFSIVAQQEIFFALFYLISILSYLYFLEEPNYKRYFISVISIALCILTKWLALTILPVILIYTVISQRKKIKESIILICLTLIVLSPYYFVMYKVGLLFLPFESNILPDIGEPQWYELKAWLYYPKTLLFDSFFPITGLLIILFTIKYLIQNKIGWKILFVWILIGYLLITILPNKNPKYIINILPALVIPSSYFIYNSIKKHKILVIAFLTLIFLQFIYALLILPRGMGEIEKINEVITKDGGIGIIISYGQDAPFVFEVARGNKFGHQVFRQCLFVETNETFENITKNYGVRYVVIWKELDRKEFEDVAEKVKNSFKLIAEFDNYLVYENLEYVQKNNILCNYVCITKGIICSKFINPKDAFK